MALTVKTTPLLRGGNYSTSVATLPAKPLNVTSEFAKERRTKATGPKKKRGAVRNDPAFKNVPRSPALS